MTDYVEAFYGLLLALVAIVEVFRYRAAKDSQERASLSPDDQSRLLEAEDQVAATKKAAKQSTQALANLRKQFRRRSRGAWTGSTNSTAPCPSFASQTTTKAQPGPGPGTQPSARPTQASTETTSTRRKHHARRHPTRPRIRPLHHRTYRGRGPQGPPPLYGEGDPLPTPASRRLGERPPRRPTRGGTGGLVQKKGLTRAQAEEAIHTNQVIEQIFNRLDKLENRSKSSRTAIANLSRDAAHTQMQVASLIENSLIENSLIENGLDD